MCALSQAYLTGVPAFRGSTNAASIKAWFDDPNVSMYLKVCLVPILSS